MAPSIFERIQARIELFRLEQRYTRRRNRRSTFVSNAIYVDGEYIYQTPNATGSSVGSNTSHGSSGSSRPQSRGVSPVPQQQQSEKERKRLNRFSSMPGFGSISSKRSTMPSVQDWRPQRASTDQAR